MTRSLSERARAHTDRESAVAEISDTIVGRLHNTLAERGVAGSIGLPTTALRAARPGRPTATAP